MSSPERIFEAYARRCLTAGLEPIPVKGKRPAPMGWTEGEIDANRVEGWIQKWPGASVGLRTGAIIAIDLDLDHEDLAEAVAASAEFDLGPPLVRCSRPGRLLLVYRADPDEAPGRKKLVVLTDPSGNEKRLEVLQHGQQFVAFGVHPDTLQPYTWRHNADPTNDDPCTITEAELVAWLESAAQLVAGTDGWSLGSISAMTEDERWLANYRAPRSLEAMAPEERVNTEALARFADWVFGVFPAGALREYQGGYRVSSESLGRDLEEDLSLHPDGIRDHGEEIGMTATQVVARWKTEGDEVQALEWLAAALGVELTEQAKAAEQAQALRGDPTMRWAERIESANTGETMTRIAQAVGVDSSLTDLDRERLVGMFQARYFDITGERLAKGVVRGALARRRRSGGGNAPEWVQGWYYVTHCDKLFRYARGQWVTTQGFNALYQRELPANDDGRRPSALRMALDDFEIPVVDETMYAPHLGERFSVSGRSCVNGFTPASVPAAAPHLSTEDNEAAQAVARHIDLLCSGRPTIARALLDWLAHQVQHPGVKVRWSPIIKGIEGDGKTVLLELMAACLGDANVRVVGPSVVTTDFNGWAEGSCVVGLEEVRIVGHNRYDAMNALKPLITNTTVDIHKKGQDPRNALNVTNYLAFTNYSDALPITAVDRRWFVIFTPWSGAGAMEEILGEPMHDYFGRLHQAIQEHAPGLRRWLLDHEIHPAFAKDGHAPPTPEKESMRVADAEDEEQALVERLEMGGFGVGESVLATDCLRELPNGTDFDADGLVDLPRGKGLARCLQRLGWVAYPKPIKWKNKTRRVWVKGMNLEDNEAVRSSLDATAAKK